MRGAKFLFHQYFSSVNLFTTYSTTRAQCHTQFVIVKTQLQAIFRPYKLLALSVVRGLLNTERHLRQ